MPGSGTWEVTHETLLEPQPAGPLGPFETTLESAAAREMMAKMARKNPDMLKQAQVRVRSDHYQY